MQPPYPRWYNENARCDYHSGNRGHSTKDCTVLKRRVHDLIKAGALAFDDKDVFDVNKNHLPDHQRPKINAVESDSELQIEKDIRAVRMHMKTVYEALLKAATLDEEQEKKEKKKIETGNIVYIIRGLWVTLFKIISISSNWCRK